MKIKNTSLHYIVTLILFVISINVLSYIDTISNYTLSDIFTVYFLDILRYLFGIVFSLMLIKDRELLSINLGVFLLIIIMTIIDYYTGAILIVLLLFRELLDINNNNE